MQDRNTLKSVAKLKLQAAKILYEANDYDTAGYLLGYVVECVLKAAICKRLRLQDYPDSKRHRDVFASHALDRLLILSGLSSDISLTKNIELYKNWSTLTKDWKPEIRYNLSTYDSSTIEDKLKALEDKPNGFLSWIKKGRW